MIDLMKKNNSVKVVNDQIGSPTYAYDLAKVIIEIIMNNKNKSGLFHYSNEGEISLFEFAKSIREFYNLDCKIIGVSSKEFKKQPFSNSKYGIKQVLMLICCPSSNLTLNSKGSRKL